MPRTLSLVSGDGINNPRVICSVTLPDSGQSIALEGTVQPIGASPGTPGTIAAISGSPLTAPAIPGSGSIYWNIQVNVVTGVATVQQSTVADPAALTNNVIIFRMTLVPASPTAYALNATAGMPNFY